MFAAVIRARSASLSVDHLFSCGVSSGLQERTVKSVVMQMGVHEVYDVVSNMKQLVEKEPDKAKQMFVSHPQVRRRNL